MEVYLLMADAKVLIVEDEVIVAMGLERSLGSFGYDVVGLATKGEDAVRMAGELMPDLALIDINLGDKIDGIDVAERIGENWDIPVVYLTSYTGDETLSRAIETNPYGYLTKPARPREIYTTIETVLQKHRAIKAERACESGEKKFNAIFNSLPFPACVISLGEDNSPDKIMEANENFLRISGITESALKSVKPGLIFGEDLPDAVMEAAKSEAFEYSAVLRASDKNFIEGLAVINRADYERKKQVVLIFIPKDKGFPQNGGSFGKNISDSTKSLINSLKQPLSAIVAISGLKGGMEFEEISLNAEKIQRIISEFEK